MTTQLNVLRDLAHSNSKKKGFYEREFNIGEKLMLITSELGEALEADRKGRYAELAPFHAKVESMEEVYNPAVRDDAYKRFFEQHMKDTVEDEIADALIRIMDLCGALNIDIDKHVKYKMEYNALRAKLHGKAY
jgi:NTP pyrophosphatase (non-canonical NTP hydrolase)